MGKVPRGALFRGTETKKRKGDDQDQAPAAGAVVFFGGKKAATLGSVIEVAPAKRRRGEEDVAVGGSDAAILSQLASVSSGVGFHPRRYRLWTREEVLQLDGDIRKGLKDEEKLIERSVKILRRASKEATKKGEAGPLNKAISDYGADKQLGFAMKALNRLRSVATPTVYTLSGIVNACVRCGDVEEAVTFVREAEDKWNVTPNEVVLTALMKGLCGDGRQKEATALLMSMKAKYNADPNDRMASTMLRGCMRNTDGRSVLVTLGKLAEIGLFADRNPSAMEYCVKALSYDGMLKEAAQFLADGRKNINQAACIALATACVLAGETELAKAAIASAKLQLDAHESKQKEAFMHSMATGDTNTPAGEGQKRAKSAAMFNTLRDREVAADIEKLEDTMLGVTPLTSTEHKTYKADPMVAILPLAELDLTKYFKDLSLPLRVEVCSGHGEWVVARAASEVGKANWIGVEIRPDRVCQAWTKRRLLGKEEPKDNLLLVCGDARLAVDLLAGKNVHDLFINYPEPPGWMGSKSNLLDDAFFTGVHKTLATGGAVTLMSDHALYSAYTAMRLVKQSKSGLYYSSLPPGNGLPITTDAPANYGSSYFDRMWLNGKRRKRFFVNFIKANKGIASVLCDLEGGDPDGLLEPAEDKIDVDVDVESDDDDGGAPRRRRVSYV